MPIKISFLPDAARFLRSTKDSQAALDDVADSLDDVARGGDRAQDRLERSFRQIARDARDTGHDVSDVGDVGARGFSKLGEKGAEVGSELRQNLGETFASFKGDLADLPQIAQDTLGGLAGAGALGGIAGLAVTAAGAAGLGLITTAIQQQQADAERLKERLSDAYSSAVDDGKAYLDTAYLIADAHDVMFNKDRAGEWQKIQDTQKTTGLDMSVILKANAGDAESLAIVLGAVKQANHDAAASGKEVNLVEGIFGDNLDHLNDYWKDLGTTSKQSQQKAQDALSYTSSLLLDQIANTKDATVQVDKFGNRLVELPDGKQIVISAATGQATTDLTKFKGDVNSVPKRTTTTAKLLADTSSVDAALAKFRNSPPDVYVRIKTTGGRYIQ